MPCSYLQELHSTGQGDLFYPYETLQTETDREGRGEGIHCQASLTRKLFFAFFGLSVFALSMIDSRKATHLFERGKGRGRGERQGPWLHV